MGIKSFHFKFMKVIIISIILITMANTLKSQSERSVDEAKGLNVGAAAPMFFALDADSNIFSLDKALKNGPVVLIFYRGFWCPVCNKHLGQIQDSLQLIEKMGAKVIAVSPEKPEYLGVMEEKTGAQFTLLYDEDYKIADAYDVTFKPSASTLFTYNTFLGANLKETHSDDSQRLPIPATYIIGQDGKIARRQFDPDYKNRSTVKDILDALSDLK
jgi:peroxiredoxin